MYIVTWLAWSMFRHPAIRAFPHLLVHAKAASSALSFGMFFVHQRHLIYLANGVVDGLIGVLILVLLKVSQASKEEQES